MSKPASELCARLSSAHPYLSDSSEPSIEARAAPKISNQRPPGLAVRLPTWVALSYFSKEQATASMAWGFPVSHPNLARVKTEAQP